MQGYSTLGVESKHAPIRGVIVVENVIKIRGARQHNLKNIDLDIPKNKLVCFTGVSGSGKSSLALDTIYAEGQRRYVESLSTYAIQFLGIMDKPDVDLIEGLSPAISIDQKATSRNPRSTVGTVTEIYDYLRLLFARAGHPHCPVCGKEISSQSLDEIVQAALKLCQEKLLTQKSVKFLILSPIVINRKGEFANLFANLKAKGFSQVRVDREIKDLNEDFVLIKTNKHTIEAVIDRFSFGEKDLKDGLFIGNLKTRLSDSIEQGLSLSDGLIIFSEIVDKSFELPLYPRQFLDSLFSEKFSCPKDNIQISEIEPRTFSFNSPQGACQSCNGIGKISKVDPNFIFSEEISIKEGGILPFANIFEHDTWYARLILKVCQEKGIDSTNPIKNLNNNQKNILLCGTGEENFEVQGTNRFGKLTRIHEIFPGVILELERRYKTTESEWVRHEIEKYMQEVICPVCTGTRLKNEALSITIAGLSISDITKLSISESLIWIENLNSDVSCLSNKEKNIVGLIIDEIVKRLEFLISTGLDYLTLERGASTLSSGEAQRIRLASQIGSGLTGVLYVLDEPTIGLHPRDNQKLLKTLKKLRDLGNTVIVVEHDEETIRNSDFVFDFGPGAGKYGGKIVFFGTPEEISHSQQSETGNYLSGEKKIRIIIPVDQDQVFKERPVKSLDTINIYGCSQYNLKSIDVIFPLKKMVVVTGVSGSGKSTLLSETLYPALSQKLNPRFRGSIGKHKRLEGWENISRVVLVDQSPIGRTPRSNPATYTKVFDLIREIYAQTYEARANGFKKGRFSFNLKGGRCDACEGQGKIKIEMQFMSDIWINCEVCKGKRFNSQTLEINFKGKNIAEVLGMTVGEAEEFFHAHRYIQSKLETIKSVGLGYIQLGQPATTLSGGEAQRVKLSAELSKKSGGNTVYILDEPTTGLHFADVEKLLTVLKILVAKGNSVFIIEHNLDVIKNSDWIIDLGPEGGEKGGYLVAEGTVDFIKNSKNGYTAYFLKKRKKS
ncbi:MAG: UvrABC system protein A [Candidatus Woesebacteria bacterium GW2011_GWB1_38_5b]|uniref:UvrABC system protein A n=1 Tax=Candidatus Woesebacteria bacterium GW2011_GWB1_38_5b TaxID=1618569 RepID=A0A0G0KHL1_9BACT|nr:MAG: UvrABC system protein A [Candidatus Woesebacteria bacterium GW2011_GWB1_38_5b]